MRGRRVGWRGRRGRRGRGGRRRGGLGRGVRSTVGLGWARERRDDFSSGVVYFFDGYRGVSSFQGLQEHIIRLFIAGVSFRRRSVMMWILSIGKDGTRKDENDLGMEFMGSDIGYIRYEKGNIVNKLNEKERCNFSSKLSLTWEGLFITTRSLRC
jgi:hypothetical protein